MKLSWLPWRPRSRYAECRAWNGCGAAWADLVWLPALTIDTNIPQIPPSPHSQVLEADAAVQGREMVELRGEMESVVRARDAAAAQVAALEEAVATAETNAREAREALINSTQAAAGDEGGEPDEDDGTALADAQEALRVAEEKLAASVAAVENLTAVVADATSAKEAAEGALVDANARAEGLASDLESAVARAASAEAAAEGMRDEANALKGSHAVAVAQLEAERSMLSAQVDQLRQDVIAAASTASAAAVPASADPAEVADLRQRVAALQSSLDAELATNARLRDEAAVLGERALAASSQRDTGDHGGSSVDFFYFVGWLVGVVGLVC